MTAGRLGAIALVAALLADSPAVSAERILALELIMNGRPTGRIGAFTDHDGTLFATPAELRALGFALPGRTGAGTEPIPLSALPDIHVMVNESKQTLVVVASDVAQQPTELGGTRSAPLVPMSPSGYGAVLNYDILGTFSGGQNTGGALVDLRGFSPYGLLQGTGLSRISPSGGQQTFVRLDTTYTFSEADKTRRWRAGDVVTGALPWSRAVRLGGVQMSSDFGLRPDLITYPLPVISSSAALPSTVNVLVNGIRQFSEIVQPGPFAVHTLPVVTGAGEVAVAVQDALGRQTLVTLPFYASTALLRQGLASYSFEAGMVRRNFGFRSDGYADWAVNGSARYGLSDWLTVEGHGEGTSGIGLLGAGMAIQVSILGTASLSISGSSGRSHDGITTRTGRGNTGGQISAGFQRVGRGLNFDVSGTVSTNSYRDIAAVNGSPIPRSTFTASFGYQFGAAGSIGAAYLKQTSQVQGPGSLQAQLGYSILSSSQVELVTASYNVPIASTASFYASGFKDLRKGSSYGVGVGLTFALGESSSASVGGAVENGRFTSSVYASKYALTQNDYGYRMQDSEGFAARRSAEAEFLSSWGRVSAGVDQSAGHLAGRAGARGALVVAGGDVFAGDQIYDSFAVVNTGDVAGVPVLYENRPVGKTNASGHLLIPSLRSFQNNQLAVDVTRLPADIDVGQTSVLVRPPDRSGVMVDFRVGKVNAALLRLQDSNGHPLPLGSVVKVEGAEDAPVGYDGEAYVTGLKPTNRVSIRLPNETRCSVQFHYMPVKGDIPVIGPLHCQ